MATVSKTDYIRYRNCKRDAWVKIHEPAVYHQYPLSEFEKELIKAGKEVEAISNELFPGAIKIQGRDEKAQEKTQEHLMDKTALLFQPVFEKDGFLAIVDTLKFDEKTGKYSIYEVKASNRIKPKEHHYDLAFQFNLLKKCGLDIDKAYLVHLNPEYIRFGAIDPEKLFLIEDLTKVVEDLSEEVAVEMEGAKKYLSQESVPSGCGCVYKGRSAHCTTFAYSNPGVPEYSVHDLTLIGNSKKRLEELIDSNVLHIHEVPGHIKLTDKQNRQIEAHKSDTILIREDIVKAELSGLHFPLYFLDYETCPAALPRFNGFSPFQQIPFQYSLYVLKSPEDELEHFEFLYTGKGDPSREFAESLEKDIGDSGSIIVWNKTFECGINTQLGERIPEMMPLMEAINNRVYDLMDIFQKQHFIHKDFRGKYSIKKVLPVLVPELTYKDLDIQEGTAASLSWNRLTTELLSEKDKQKIITDLKKYCGLDTLAMYAIWKELHSQLLKPIK